MSKFLKGHCVKGRLRDSKGRFKPKFSWYNGLTASNHLQIFNPTSIDVIYKIQ